MGNLLDLFVFKYNRTDFHELNLDWLISDVKTLAETLQNFVNLNTIKYADPIQWNITKQYEANTVVIDGNNGTAYISTKPVPSGVALTNTDYWTVVFTLDILSANQNITFRNDATNVIATFESAIGDWLLWNYELYKVIRQIDVNEAYVPGYNIERTSVENFIREYITNIENLIGDLSDLDTSSTDSIVDAINSMITERGSLSDLDTTDKSSVVNAINEVVTSIGSLNPTQAVLAEYFGAVGNGVADDTVAIQNAINNAQIVILKNTYRITSSITVREGVTIVGPGSVVIDGQFDAFIINDNCSIVGLSFTDTLTNYLDDKVIIYANEKNNITIKNCSFSNIHIGYCIRLDKCDYLTIDYNNINVYSYSGIMLINGCQHGSVQYNKIVNGRSSNANRYPISFSGYFEIADRPARFIKCNYNNISDDTAVWEGIDSHACEDCEVIGNIITGTRYGIAFGTPSTPTLASGSSCKNIIVKNNIITVAVGEGLVYGISFNSTNGHGRSDLTNIEVSNNRIFSSGTPAYTSSIISAITFRATAVGFRNIKVSNNEIQGVTNGISFDGISAASILIENNYLRSLRTAGTAAINFSDCAANFVADCINIIGNMISNCVLDFAGPTSALTGRGLIKYDKNIDAGNYANIVYSSNPRSTAPNATTKSCGVAGDFIPCSATGTIAGWMCNNTNHWIAISGTAI